jgi:hypothetical protein
MWAREESGASSPSLSMSAKASSNPLLAGGGAAPGLLGALPRMLQLASKASSSPRTQRGSGKLPSLGSSTSNRVPHRYSGLPPSQKKPVRAVSPSCAGASEQLPSLGEFRSGRTSLGAASNISDSLHGSAQTFERRTAGPVLGSGLQRHMSTSTPGQSFHGAGSRVRAPGRSFEATTLVGPFVAHRAAKAALEFLNDGAAPAWRFLKPQPGPRSAQILGMAGSGLDTIHSGTGNAQLIKPSKEDEAEGAESLIPTPSLAAVPWPAADDAAPGANRSTPQMFMGVPRGGSRDASKPLSATQARMAALGGPLTGNSGSTSTAPAGPMAAQAVVALALQVGEGAVASKAKPGR